MPKPKIYESPDGGKTVYIRDFGQTDRHLISGNNNLLSPKNGEQLSLLRDVIRAAETDPDLRELLDQAIMLYQLKRDLEETHA
jgi:hypothetical protein